MFEQEHQAPQAFVLYCDHEQVKQDLQQTQITISRNDRAVKTK